MIIRGIFLLISFTALSQNYTLKNISVRTEQNTYFVTSPPFVDKDGAIWYCTNKENSFYKYDGRNKIEYKFYNKDKKNAISTDLMVFSWLQDFNGNIWAIGQYGCSIINPKTFKVRYRKWKSKETGYVNPFDIAAVLDRKGNIWMSISENYIIKFDRFYNCKIVECPASVDKMLESNNERLKVIRELADGRMLVKSWSSLFIIDDKGMHFYRKLKNSMSSIIKDYVFIENGRMFPKNQNGTFSVRDKKINYEYLKEIDLQMFEFPGLDIGFIYQKGKVLSVSGKTLCIGVFDKEKQSIKYSDSIVLKNLIISYKLNTAKNDVIYFSTPDNIYMLKVKHQLFKNTFHYNNSDPSIKAIVSDRDSSLFALSSSGILKYGLYDKIVSKVSDSIGYNSLAMSNDSILWLASYHGGIDKLNLGTRKIMPNFFLPNNLKVTFIKKMSHDCFYIGTNRGLFTFDPETEILEKLKIESEGFEGVHLTNALKTSSGNLWISSSNGLFLKIKGKKAINFLDKNPLLKNKVFLVIHEDKNKNIWLGTNNSGAILLNFKTGKIEIFDQSRGLCNNNICGILESDKKMWFSTYYGLAELNKKSLKINNYYDEDGISQNQFNINAFHKGRTGIFYFGGTKGITEFNPESFNFNDTKSRIYSSRTEYFSESKNKNVVIYGSNSEIINIPYDKNYLSVEVAVNDLFNNEKNTYYYKIKGYIENWADAGPSGIIKLYNLPAGDYILNVKGKDYQGSDTVNQIEIKIHVRQVFYKTNYFIVLIFMLSLSSVILFFIRKARKQKKIFERKMEITTLKTNALKAQMNPHFIFNMLNNMQSVILLKDEQEANKYFGAFSRLLRLTLNISKQHLVSLEEELKYINDYLILNNMQLNNQLIFSINANAIDKTQDIFIPGMLVQPFVENSIVHGLSPKESDDKTIIIHCCVENNYLIINITDNGIGRAAALKLNNKRNHQYKSWSTSIVEERIKILNASSSEQDISFRIIDNELNAKSIGTTVIIRFKLN
ncbi:hypothetical protein B0A81_18635 [Flavobacterium plurextorum]|uniref:Two component regulator propeller n=1 Tax=Flavobacterium plurextorum TaxID=1114867 RepID=A0ABX4CR43_9FLAO|nr:histidine kinase [Flavobacterium plurextorum]OXB03349.1 hypothetical protein B0A81_18635 [Flavobacterium plurextorum]